MELVLVDVLAKSAHLFDTDVSVFEELDPDGTDGRGFGIGVWHSIFFYHFERRVGLEGHPASAVGIIEALVYDLRCDVHKAVESRLMRRE